MAKACSDAVLDGTLDVIATATKMIACSAQPTTYTEANSTYALADIVIDSGDFTKANGDTNGRKVTIGAQSSVTVDSSGTATHVALVITGSSTLLYVTTCTSQALTAANTVNFPAWDIEIADPT
jgi:fructose-specific component phosphotransferase system IIB-like protein